MSIMERVEKETTLERRTPISVDSLKKAIGHKCASCWTALSLCNSLGGEQDDAWYLCYRYTLKQLIDEAARLGVDLDGVKSSVDGIEVKRSLYYRRATGELPEAEFRAAFRRWQSTGVVEQ